MRNPLQALVTALALVLAPVVVQAAPGPEATPPVQHPTAPADAEQPAPPTDAAQPAPPTDAEQPTPPTDAAQPAPPPDPATPPDGVFAPIEIPPTAPLPKPEPPPEPEPVVDPVPEPVPEPVEPPVEGPQIVNPEQLEKIQKQRRAGIAVMSTGGAVVAAGIGLTLAFTVVGDQKQGAEDPILADIEDANSVAKLGGVVLASGVALAAVGGLLFANANRKAEQRKIDSMARVRVAPAFGGLVLSGQF